MAKVMRDRRTGESLGFAFLECVSRPAAQNLLNNYDGKQITENMILRLNWAAFSHGRPAGGEPPPEQDAQPGGEGPELYSIFVGDMALNVTDLHLQNHFRQFFLSVNSAKVITDRLTGKSKGYGFVRFLSSEERDRALRHMDGHIMGGKAISVSEATLKKYKSDGTFYPSDLDPNNHTVFVGNVNQQVEQEDLLQFFRRCGDITDVKLLRTKGCAFVTYASRSSAERAIRELHGKILNNCAIRLSWGRRTKARRDRATDEPLPPPYLPLLSPGGMRLPPPMYPHHDYPTPQDTLPWHSRQGGLQQGGLQQGGVPQGGMPLNLMHPLQPLPAGSLSDLLSNPVAPSLFDEQSLGAYGYMGGGMHQGLPQLPQRVPSVSEALQAFAHLAMGHPPSPGPHSY